MNHFEAALGIASSLNCHNQLFWSLFCLGWLFSDQGRSNDAHVYIQRAKSHAANNTYQLGCAMKAQAWFWYEEDRLGEAKSEISCAISVFEKLGVTKKVEAGRELLQRIEDELAATSRELGKDGESPRIVVLPMFIDSPFSVEGTE